MRSNNKIQQYAPLKLNGNWKVIRLFLCLLIGIAFASSAHSQKLAFNRVMPPPGKNFVHVTGMVQDKRGYMWLATKNGLFRYDGYQVIQYKNNPLNPNSLAVA